jgi:hypothetical protein
VKVQPVVLQAGTQVGAFRRRLHEAEYSWSDDEAVDLQLLCELFLSCPVIPLVGLSDRAALYHLHTQYGFDTSGETPDDAPLAGGLYLGHSGMPRWIFVEHRDSPERQRFSVAHEIGHLVLQAEPEIARESGSAGKLFDGGTPGTITRFSRCGYAEMDAANGLGSAGGGYVPSSRPGGTRPVWSEADLREIAANHFAAELLMPLEGVRRLIGRETGVQGIRTDREVEHLTSVIASTYQVSHACARKRLTKDLGIVPVARSPNADLFD